MAGFNSMLSTSERAPYVVLLGDVGTGKSTLVEKLTGIKGRSSDANESFTQTFKPFCVPDGSLVVADTPGGNALKDKLDHNLEIARALNFRPVSRIFIVVKAETRIDSVVDNARKYADRFVELPMDVVGVLVTHMDMVDWTEKEFIPPIEDELGIDTVVFSWITTNHETLRKNIINSCIEEHNLTVDDENFFELFKIPSNHCKILKSTSDEVKRFSEKKKAFDEARKAFSGKDLVDLVFEFQAYMTDEIVEAQKRMSETNNFTFEGDVAAIEAGHVANMVNQLRTVLYDIRTECLGYQTEHGVSELRKCPHCGIIWTKPEGCEGNTTCGNRLDNVNDLRDPANAEMGTFSFRWLVDGQLRITKVSHKTVKSERSSKPQFGCGKSINWKEMATVAVPPELSESVNVGTSDIKTLQPTAANLREEPSKMIYAVGRKGSKRKRKSKPSNHETSDMNIPPPTAANLLEEPSKMIDAAGRKSTKRKRKSKPWNHGTSDINTLQPTAANSREELSKMIDSAGRKSTKPERKSKRSSHETSDISIPPPTAANSREEPSKMIDSAGRKSTKPERKSKPSSHETSDINIPPPTAANSREEPSKMIDSAGRKSIKPERKSKPSSHGTSDINISPPTAANFREKPSKMIDAAGTKSAKSESPPQPSNHTNKCCCIM
ncbi:uncharacterized protein [Montipora capricornis]